MRHATTRLILLTMLATPALAQRDAADIRPTRQAILRFHGEPDADLVQRHGGRVGKRLWIVNGVAATIPVASWDALAKHPRVASIEVDGVAQAFMPGKPAKGISIYDGESTPWGITRVHAPEAWAAGARGAGVKVAILDTGMGPNADLPTPALQKDFVNNDDDATDDEGHGTHVAGTIAAQGANGIGVVGVAPDVDLLIGKVLDRRGSGSYSDIIAGVQWAVASGAQVINMSLGGESDSVAFHEAIASAHAAGVLVVVAAGNDAQSGNDIQFPAAYPEAFAVAATTGSDGRASFSSYGSWVDIAAPGQAVLSTLPGDLLDSYNGTSMATPHVAGCAALALSAGAATPADARARLEYWAQDLGAAGWDEQFGAGLADAQAALRAVPAPAPIDLAAVLEAPASANVGDTLPLVVTVHNLGANGLEQGCTVEVWRDDDGDDTPDSQVGDSVSVSVPADGFAVLTFSAVAGATAGTESYLALVIVDDDGDLQNNASWASVDVIDPSQTAVIYVSALEYTNAKRDLRVTLTITNANDDQPVPGAAVTITLNLNGSAYGTASATTNDVGQVTFRARNAPSGDYTTTVDSVSLTGAIYDPSRDASDPGETR